MDAKDKAAFEFYKVYCLAQGLLPLTDWNDISEQQKEGWLAIAQRFADALGQYIIIYGYNGKEPYESELDKLISKGKGK